MVAFRQFRKHQDDEMNFAAADPISLPGQGATGPRIAGKR
jgi:hypothetical protein